jgi:hypothetical protein
MFSKIGYFVFLFICSTLIIAQPSFKQALKLNGANQFLEIPNKDYLNIDGKRDFTFEIKFKPNILKPAVLVSKFDADGMGNMKYGYLVELYKKGNVVNYKVPEIFEGSYNATFVRKISKYYDQSYGYTLETTIWDTVNWSHYTIARSSVPVRLWNEYDMMNDQVFIKGSIDKPLSLLNSSPIYIGGYPTTDSVNNRLVFYDGYIDEIRIWNRFRTKEQILATANDTLSNKYYSTMDSNLVAYYRFDKIEELKLSDGTTYKYCIRDLTPNKNHAKLLNNGILVDHTTLVTAIKDRDLPLNSEFNLHQNYPNPFNPETAITYDVPTTGFVSLKVFDMLGREVASLVNETKLKGQYKTMFSGSELPSGVYFYKLQAGNYAETKKMILLK